MIIQVDRSLCAGHAVCALVGGEDLFPLDDDGFSIADGIEAGERVEQARAGTRACPERAIRLVDAVTGRDVSDD